MFFILEGDQSNKNILGGDPYNFYLSFSLNFFFLKLGGGGNYGSPRSPPSSVSDDRDIVQRHNLCFDIMLNHHFI